MKRPSVLPAFARTGLRWPGAPALLAWLMPLFAWAPLAYPGYLEFHSGFLPIFNLTDLLAHRGNLAWVPAVGQPYDLLRGEGALPYWLVALPRLLGAPSAVAVKLVFGASLLAGAVGMYGWARRRLGAWPALIAAAVYVYWPVGLATTYVRGAFAEAVLLGLVPWVLWAVDTARPGGYTRANVGLTAETPINQGLPGPEGGSRVVAVLAGARLFLGLGLPLALWTHPGLACWLAAIVLVYGSTPRRTLWQVLRLKPMPENAKRASAGSEATGASRTGAFLARWLGWVALGVVGLLPTILRHGWGGSTYVDFTDHFVYSHQLLMAGWGAGPSVPGPDDTLTFSLGVMAFGLAVLGLVLPRAEIEAPGCAPGGQEVPPPPSACAAFSLAAVLVLAFLSTNLAAPVWHLLPLLAHTLTYPWQLLLLAGPWLSWLAGLGGQRLLTLLPDAARERDRAALASALIVAILLGAYGNLRPVASASSPLTPVAIYGENEIALLSAVTAGTPGPGGQVTVSVQWQALRPLAQDYTVFFHAIGPEGMRYGQQDTVPQGGQWPTSLWRPGQVVTDQYRFVLSADAPVGGEYRYWLGFYAPETGRRLTVGDVDKVVLAP